MAIPNKQIGWSQESNLLWEVAKKVAHLGQVISSNAGEDNVGVFYVSKNYSGIGDARYGFTITNTGVTSSNGGFLDQLANARMGDANKPYPDPWAARNDAFVAIANGDIQKALIVVNGGNTWTYGNATSSLNGDINGNIVTTVADVKLVSGNNIASLMQNNIDYFFMPNTELIGIARTFAFHLGYNVDTTNTKWVSGIYGYGKFISPYGTNNGFSQRMFQIANGNGEMTIECDTIICQRAWLIVNGGEAPKLLKLRAKTVITDATGNLLFNVPAHTIGTEATSPSVIDINIDQSFKGQKYFPYTSWTQVSSGDNTRPIIETNTPTSNTSTRQKSVTCTIKNCYVHDTCGWLIRDGNTAVYEGNITIALNIDYLKHELNLSKTGFLTRGAIGLNNSVSSVEKVNKYIHVNINTAHVEEAILSTTNFASRNANSINNFLHIKIGTIIKTGSYAGSTGQYIFGIPSTSAGSTGQPMKTIIECGYAQSNLGNVFRAEELPFQGNTLFRNNMIVKGTFKTTAASPVFDSILLTSGNTGIVLDNASLITAGTQSISSTTIGDIYYSKQAYSNVAVNGANITTQGTFNVDANIANFI